MQDTYWEEYLPLALQCGMSSLQFWEGEPRLLNSYIKKHEMELDEFNYKSWLFNIYTYNAVLTAVGKKFANSEAEAKEIKYLEEPIEEFYINREILTKEQKEEKIQNKYRKTVNFWAKFKRKGGKNNNG